MKHCVSCDNSLNNSYCFCSCHSSTQTDSMKERLNKWCFENSESTSESISMERDLTALFTSELARRKEGMKMRFEILSSATVNVDQAIKIIEEGMK